MFRPGALLPVVSLLFLGETPSRGLFVVPPASAFHSSPQVRRVGWPGPTTSAACRARSACVVLAAKKKGFAKPQNKSTAGGSSDTTDSTAAVVDSADRSGSSAVTVQSSVSTSEKITPADDSSTSPSMNAGQRALEKMRRERAEQKDQELRKVRELLRADEQVQDTPAAIPEKVAMRMGQRMLPFVGVPLLGSMGTFVGFWYMRTYQNMEFQPSLVATSTVFFLVVGLLGITYSVMSASWDENREGDLLGAEEFKKNLDNIKDGLSRSRENALLRERMAGLSDAELKRALQELDKKEGKRSQSLQSKLEEDLE